MTEMATRVRAQNSTAAPRHEAQIPNMHRGGEASKHPRNQISVPTTRIDLAKIRPSSLSSDPERRSTSAGDPDNRMAIDPTPSPSRAEGGTRANDKKPPTGATTPRNSIFFELPSSDCPKAQSTDLIQRLETEMEEKVLRYKLSIKARPMLEWFWMKESSRGGTECTILAHIDSGTSALSIQNKRYLHWKELDDKTSMGNEMEFSALAHSLLMKTEAVQSEHQEIKNRSANFQASPQAARKKRYMKLNFAALASTEAKEESNPGRMGEVDGPLESLASAYDTETGSFGSKAARNRLNYA
ncbi:unnamed protein product [Sphagnum jensenii]|uniref:Uncharacterized protein n=1 Tax=Sphagnum jensenii TaxID=128206 RepID=A0ABP0VWC7_9BRYO